MFIKKTKKENGSVHISIVESIRSGDQVKHKTLRSLGQHKDPKQIEIIEEAAKKLVVEIQNHQNPVLPIFDPYDFYISRLRAREATESDKVNFLDTTKEQRINNGLVDVYGSQFDQLGLGKLIEGTNKDSVNQLPSPHCLIYKICQIHSK